MNPPNSCVNLKKAISRLATEDPVRLGREIANAVLGQMLPEGVVKGGSSLLFRYGGASARYTRDLDAARVSGEREYAASLEARLRAGWNGFTGRLAPVAPPSPPGVPPAYLMRPWDVKLDYLGKAWMTVRIEIGHDEIGDADSCEREMPEDLAKTFLALGFPRPDGIPVMRLPYQIAQKLHAVTAPGSARAHDLVDLQLIEERSRPDLSETAATCRRLFAYRKAQPWPPRVVLAPGWDSIYAGALASLRNRDGVLAEVSAAVAWTNDFIRRIDEAK